MTTRAPSLGRGCRAQRGGVGFLFLRRSRLLFAFPMGKGFVRRYCFSTYACIRSDNARIAASSFRSLPHAGKGDRAAVDRVLSQTAYLRRSLPALFHTARTLSGSLRSPPSPRGEGFVSRKAVSPYRSLVFSSLRVRMYPHRLSIFPRNPRA